MNTTIEMIKKWQQALNYEILHIKQYGSRKYQVFHAEELAGGDPYTYYFQTAEPLTIPPGALVRFVRGAEEQEGRVLSSEGKTLLLSFEKPLSLPISEAYIYHDPWELLEQLNMRLDEVKKSKRKRLRLKRLLDPSMPAKQPAVEGSNVKELFLRSKYNPVTFVWGPPGTGKTYTLARTAANHFLKEQQVLILSHSNQAVDVLMAETAAFLKKKKKFSKGSVLRYGSGSSAVMDKHPELLIQELLKEEDPELIQDQEMLKLEKKGLQKDLSGSFSERDSGQLIELEKKLARVLEKIRRKETDLVKNTGLLGTTLAKAASDPAVYEKEYDLVIVDEASMAYIPQAAFAASLGKHVIICGDFKQLPPIASGRHPLITEFLREDIFHGSGVAATVDEGRLHPHLFLLKEQRRMHPDISAFTNRYIYNGLVGDHPDAAKNRNAIREGRPFPGRAAVLLDTSFSGSYCIPERTSGSRMNLWHLLISFQLLHEAFQNGARSIGYVSPYRAQAGLMNVLLDDLYSGERGQADIVAATVHRFQGSERDIIIFDSTDSFPQDRAGMLLTGKDSSRLINVAITRTKGKFIHVADTSFLTKRVYKGKTLRSLTDYQIDAGQKTGKEFIGRWIQNRHPRLEWIHARKTEAVFKDILEARKSIVFSFPGDIPPEWQDHLNRRAQGVQLSIYGKKSRALETAEYLAPIPGCSFVIIDSRYIWAGMPLDAGPQNHPPFAAARLDSLAAAERFLSQLPTE